MLLFWIFLKELVDSLKALSSFFGENSLRARRNLRGDVERRSLEISENFESNFREVNQVKLFVRPWLLKDWVTFVFLLKVLQRILHETQVNWNLIGFRRCKTNQVLLIWFCETFFAETFNCKIRIYKLKQSEFICQNH